MMKVRLKQPVVEARQWDGNLAAMEKWIRERNILYAHCEPSRHGGERLIVNVSRFRYSLGVGDWLVAGNSLTKVSKDEFEKTYERSGLHEPVSGWTPMVQAQHELAVTIPGMLLEMGEENWDCFCKWLVGFAQNTAEDPKKHAYSIG